MGSCCTCDTKRHLKITAIYKRPSAVLTNSITRLIKKNLITALELLKPSRLLPKMLSSIIPGNFRVYWNNKNLIGHHTRWQQWNRGHYCHFHLIKSWVENLPYNIFIWHSFVHFSCALELRILYNPDLFYTTLGWMFSRSGVGKIEHVNSSNN